MTFISEQNNDCYALYLAISCCAGNNNFCIDKDLKVKSSAQIATSKKMHDAKIVSLFLSRFGEEISNIAILEKKSLSEDEVRKIFEKIKVFIAKSNEINESQKLDFENTIAIYQSFFNPFSKAEALIEKAEKGDKLTGSEIRKLEQCLINAAEEKILLLNLHVLKFISQLAILIKEELTKTNVNQIDEGNRFQIKWETIEFSSAESFAINIRLHNLWSRSFDACAADLLKIAQTIDPSLYSETVKIWQFLFIMEEINRLASHFIHRIRDGAEDQKQLIFISKIYSDELCNFNKIRSKKHTPCDFISLFDKNPIATYNHTLPSINESYKKAYLLLQNEFKKNNMANVPFNPMLGIQLLSPDEFSSIQISKITQDEFTQQFSQHLNAFLENAVPQERSSFFKVFEQCLFSNSTGRYVEFENKHAKHLGIKSQLRTSETQDALASTFATLSVKENIPPDIKVPNKKSPPKVKEKPKQQKSTYVAYQAEKTQIVAKQQLPGFTKNPKKIISTTTTSTKPTNQKKLKEAPFLIDNRVKDWFRKNPQTLNQLSYANLSDETKERTKLFHAYPMVITRLMKEHGEPKNWESLTVKNPNQYYSYPGIIHQYESSEPIIPGCFADCFDTKTNSLYHHYFHKKPFHELMKTYQQSASYMSKTDLIAIGGKTNTTSFQETDEPIEEISQKHIKITKRQFSIEVDDTAKKIRYTICFPDGIETTSYSI